MLWIKADAQPGTLKLSTKSGKLELILKDAAAPLFGEVAQARFDALASALEVEGVVRVKGARRKKSD